MKNILSFTTKKQIVVGLISIGVQLHAKAEPIIGSLIPNCPAGGYSLYYVNGMDNKESTAAISTRALTTLVLPKAFDKDIIDRMTVQYIYNPTDSVSNDLFESVRQLSTGVVANTSAYFTGAFVSVLGLLSTAIPSLDGVLTKFIDQLKVSITRPLSTAGIQKVVRESVPRIVEDINKGKTVILVGHSQGNLFINEIYDEVKLVLPANKLGLLQVVHVAAPTARHLGPFIMNSSDFISELTYGNSTYTSATLKDYLLPTTHNEKVFFDKLGHNFVSTYLSRVPGINGETLQDQLISSLQISFNAGIAAALESCPREALIN